MASLLIGQEQVSMKHQQSCQQRTEYPSGNETTDCIQRLGLLGVISLHTDLPTEEQGGCVQYFYRLTGIHWHAKNEYQEGIPKYAHPLSLRATYPELLQKELVRLMNRRQSLHATWCKS